MKVLDSRYSILAGIESRESRLATECQLTFERYCKIHYVRAPKLPINCAENMSEICVILVGIGVRLWCKLGV